MPALATTAKTLKRKRITREELEQPSRSPTPSSSEGESDSEGGNIQDIFRKAFEAKFKPLDVEPKKRKVEEVVEDAEQQEEEEEPDWSGISSDDDEPNVEVVEYRTPAQIATERASKAELKAFMSSKPPSSSTRTLSTSQENSKATSEDDLAESTHLKNDLALQKLLRDSHLLSAAAATASSNASLTATGAARHKSTDLQLLALGAKTSIHAQKSMPMAHRQGISAKAKEREEKRRKEAREAGIVLEKEMKVKKKGGSKERERGIGGPSVGKFKGGMLRLSKRDVADITGDRGGGRGGRGGRGKGKRR